MFNHVHKLMCIYTIISLFHRYIRLINFNIYFYHEFNFLGEKQKLIGNVDGLLNETRELVRQM